MLSVTKPDPAVSAKIVRKYGSLRKFAAKVGVSHGVVHRTLSGKWKGRETRKAIAKELGMSHVRLFGERAA
jgi:lambda repressor-like predicted transcriptional regulator